MLWYQTTHLLPDYLENNKRGREQLEIKCAPQHVLDASAMTDQHDFLLVVLKTKPDTSEMPGESSHPFSSC